MEANDLKSNSNSKPPCKYQTPSFIRLHRRWVIPWDLCHTTSDKCNRSLLFLLLYSLKYFLYLMLMTWRFWTVVDIDQGHSFKCLHQKSIESLHKFVWVHVFDAQPPPNLGWRIAIMLQRSQLRQPACAAVDRNRFLWQCPKLMPAN